MRFEVEDGQGEHRLDLAHRVRERDVSRMMTAGGEAEPDLERIGDERHRRESPAEPLQHGLEHPGEDTERVDLPLEPLRFFQNGGGVHGRNGSRSSPSARS